MYIQSQYVHSMLAFHDSWLISYMYPGWFDVDVRVHFDDVILHTYTHAHMHTCTHAHMHTCTNAHMHTCTHAHMHTYTYTQADTNIFAYVSSEEFKKIRAVSVCWPTDPSLHAPIHTLTTAKASLSVQLICMLPLVCTSTQLILTSLSFSLSPSSPPFLLLFC